MIVDDKINKAAFELEYQKCAILHIRTQAIINID